MSAAPESITVSISVLEQMFLYLKARQVDIDGFLRSLGLDPAAMRSPDTRLPIDVYLRIQDRAAELLHDPCFGLHMGEYAEPGSWSILGYMMMNCKTLGEAVAKSGRYARIIGNLIEGRVELRPDCVRMICFTPPHAPAMSRHCFESTFSSLLRILRSLSGAPLCPLEATFIYPQPPAAGEYARVFGCPVRFAQPENSMTFDWATVNTPVQLPNPALLAYFEQYAQEFLAQMEQKETVTRAAAKIILAHLDDENLSIETVAQEMTVSVRTLQKRLAAEGVVFSDLLKDIRQRLAKKYLCENYTVEQITYLLGFSEPSVFRKAFKKWSGFTPKEYRENTYANRGEAHV